MQWYLDGVLISSEFLTAPSGARPWPMPPQGAHEPRRHYPFPAGETPTATRGRYPGHKAAVERAERETGTTGPFAKPGAPAAPHTSAAGMALSGAPGHAVDDAMKMEGLHERRDRDAIKEYLRTGGVGMDPATTAWCAAFVNSSLAQEGIKGSGSQVATSFMNWGQPASGGIQKGDVLVRNRGHRAGETGGHVGMATGRTRQGPNGLEYEMISGNSADSVRRTWEPAGSVIPRRAKPSGEQPQSSLPGQTMSDASPDPIRPGQQYAANAPRDPWLGPHIGPEMAPRGGPRTYTGASGQKVVAPTHEQELASGKAADTPTVPERISSAAIKVGDDVFTGIHHGEAWQKIRDAGRGGETIGNQSIGFVTSTGRYVTREEATRIAEGQGQVTKKGRASLVAEEFNKETGAKPK